MNFRYVGDCYVCGQNYVVIMKNKLTNNLILICAECDTMWESPELFYSGGGLIPRDTEVNLTNEVEPEEIISHGWDKYVKNMDNPIDL